MAAKKRDPKVNGQQRQLVAKAKMGGKHSARAMQRSPLNRLTRSAVAGTATRRAVKPTGGLTAWCGKWYERRLGRLLVHGKK